MMGDKKSLASVIVAGMGPEPKEGDSDKELGKMSMDSASKKLLSAIEAKSPSGISQAFQEMCDIHYASEEEPSEESEA